MMTFDVVTLFPGMFLGPFQDSMLARARRKGRVAVRVHDLRRWGVGPHRQVDDAPYGGGGGMVLKPEPLFYNITNSSNRSKTMWFCFMKIPKGHGTGKEGTT